MGTGVNRLIPMTEVSEVALVMLVMLVVAAAEGRLVPKILHDLEHPHGSPATLSFNIALTHGLDKGLARMP